MLRLAVVWWAWAAPLLDRRDGVVDADGVGDPEGAEEEAPEAWTLQGPVRGLRWGNVRAEWGESTDGHEQAGEFRLPGAVKTLIATVAF